MPEFRNRRDNPSPDVLFQEICFPDDQDYGTGAFRFVARQDALTPPAKPEPKALSAIILNVPRFQISVTVNPGTKEIPVLLGRADGSEPNAAAVFLLPSDLGAALTHDFELNFRNWQVASLRLDGTSLPRKSATSSSLRSVAGVLHAKEGEPMSIPPLGPQSPRAFTVEEKKRVITALDFELPFAFEGLEGRLPVYVVWRDIEGDVGIRTRQRHPDEIARSLGLAYITPPKSGVIVATGDPHGRINVSSIQFQFRGFVDLEHRGELFEECLDVANRFIEQYRIAKHDFRVCKVAKTDILAYGARHLFDGQVHNDWYEPVAPVTLVKAPRFPCDPFLWNALWFRYAATPGLWERLIAEARHYVAVGENRLGVVTSWTALEVVLKDARGGNVKNVFDRVGLDFGRLYFHDTKASISTCLGLLNMHSGQLRLPSGLTERIIKCYERRNAIVHVGTMRIGEHIARECVEDVYLLIRHLLDMVNLSVISQIELVSVPPSDASFSLLRVESPEWRVVLWFANGSLNASLAKQEGGTETTVSIPWSDLNWTPGQKGAILLSYDARSEKAKLAFNGPAIVAQSGCTIGCVDASLISSASIEMPEAIMSPAFPGPFLVHSRVIEPEELAELDSLFIPLADEQNDTTEEDC